MTIFIAFQFSCDIVSLMSRLPQHARCKEVEIGCRYLVVYILMHLVGQEAGLDGLTGPVKFFLFSVVRNCTRRKAI